MSKAPLPAAPGQPAPARDQIGREVRTFRQKAPPQHNAGRGDQGSHNKARHRFIKDGEVPVVHMPAPRGWEANAAAGGRSDADHAKLVQQIEEQRQRADAAERARTEAVNQVRLLQTKAAHTEMALADATALAEARLHEITALQESLRSALEARPAPSRAAPVAAAALPIVIDEPAETVGTPAAAPLAVVKRGRGRPRKVPLVVQERPEQEPEPVEWWLAPVKASGKRQRGGRTG